MSRYIIESRTGFTAGWSPDGDGESYDSIAEAKAAQTWLARHEPENDDGNAIEYRVWDRETCSPVIA